MVGYEEIFEYLPRRETWASGDETMYKKIVENDKIFEYWPWGKIWILGDEIHRKIVEI